MNTVLLGVGSNIDRHKHIAIGLSLLEHEFGILGASSAWESDALGFDGPPFINLAVEVEVPMEVGELARFLRQLEYRLGRPRDATRFSSRTLDIDILDFAGLCGCVDGIALPRAEILDNAYVLAPLSELAPQRLHPATQQTYSALWDAHRARMQPVQRVDFAAAEWVLPFRR
ncbi:MAG: 2-amino-4-hydroxy-6-hydroxymethyldihydropteridine diphosphokinase [Halieaceae bacterium]|nr:2-amino-4-hydroxy-6-hydroxymethyldihydropteridine diphosphokinase [Halieaceae bacterium]